jgi:hypothetical protein
MRNYDSRNTTIFAMLPNVNNGNIANIVVLRSAIITLNYYN